MSSVDIASSSTSTSNVALTQPGGETIKQNATVATKIGLTVPIKEKIVKSYVSYLGSDDNGKIIPKQVPKTTILTVSATIEKLLQCLVEACRHGLEGSNFGIAHVTGPIQSHDSLVVLYPFVTEGLANVQVNKATKKAKKAVKESAASDTRNEGVNGVDVISDSEINQFSFSCSNQISKLIKSGVEHLRVASDAVDLIQYVLDEFYKKLVSGAYLIAQNSGRKTISQNDVLVSIKIMLPHKFATDILDHVSRVYSRFQSLEQTKVKPQPAEKSVPTSDKSETKSAVRKETISDSSSKRIKAAGTKSPKKRSAAVGMK